MRSNGDSRDSTALETLGDYLEGELSAPVKIRSFGSEKLLYTWLKNYREVDVAWLSQDFLRRTPPGELFRVVKNEQASTVLPPGELVAHQGVESARRMRVRETLVAMQGSSPGRAVLAKLDVEQFVAPARWLTPEWEGAPPQDSEVTSVPPQPAGLKKTAAPNPFLSAPVVPAESSAKSRVLPRVVADKEKQVFRVVTPQSVDSDEVNTPAAGAVTAVEDDRTPAAKDEPELLALPVVSAAEESAQAELTPQAKTSVAAAAVVAAPVANQPYEVAPEAEESAVPKASTVPDPAPSAEQVTESRGGSEDDGYQHLVGQIVAPERQSLRGLFNRKSISVLANVGGAFVNELSSRQLSEEDSAHYADEANMLESIEVGRSFNRESRAAEARTEQARAQSRQALALLLPSAAVRLSKGREVSKPSVETDELTGDLVSKSTHTRTDAALLVRQPLFDLPSYLDWRRREVIEEARGENYRISDGDAYTSTVNAYLSLVSSSLQTDVTRDFEVQLVNLYNYIEKRANAGASSVSDMARVDARRESTQSFRLEQESAHTTAWYEFVRLTNLVPSTVQLPVIEDIGASILPATFDEAAAMAMEENPEISSLRSELEAAKIDQSVSKGRYWPKLSAEYSYNYSEHAGGQVDPEDQRDQRLMAVLDWELFSGGRDLNEVRERTARQRELRYRLDDERRRILQELSSNYTSLATTRQRIDSGYQELESITLAAEAMSKRMLSGNQSLLDLLDVYDRLFRARSRLINLHTLEMNTLAQLVRLTRGTPWDASEAIPRGAESGRLSQNQVLQLETKAF